MHAYMINLYDDLQGWGQLRIIIVIEVQLQLHNYILIIIYVL